MKLFTLLTVFALTIGTTFAQDLTVKYDVKLSSDNPQVQAQLGMLSGSTFTVYHKDDKSRTEMNMGGMMKTVTITDTKADKGIMLIDGMMGKLAAELDSISEKSKDVKTPEVKLLDETKEILGYTCKKAVVTTEDGNKITYWYTEKIKPAAGSMGKYVKSGVPGLALEYTIETEQMDMTFTATNVAQEVTGSDDMFNMTIPDGYTKTSLDKLGKMGM